MSAAEPSTVLFCQFPVVAYIGTVTSVAFILIHDDDWLPPFIGVVLVEFTIL